MAWGGPEPAGPSGMELPRSWHQTLISRDPVPSEASEERAAGKIQLELAGLPAWAPEERTPRAGGCRGHGVPAPDSRQPRAWLLGSPGTPESWTLAWGAAAQHPGERTALGGSGFFPIRGGCSPALDPGLRGAGSSTGRGRPAQTWARPGALCPEATGDMPAVAPLPRTGAGGPCPGGLRPCSPARPPQPDTGQQVPARQQGGGHSALSKLQGPQAESERPPASLSSPRLGPWRPLVSIKHFCVLKRIPGLFFFAFTTFL